MEKVRKPQKNNAVQLTIRLNPETIEKLKIEAESLYRYMSAHASIIIEEHFKAKIKKHGPDTAWVIEKLKADRINNPT